jgi:N-acetylmuramoyl-L-alanine amidase
MDTKPSVVDPGKATAVAKPVTKATTASRSSSYSVQVAAYNRRAQADNLVTTLKARGYEARVDGDTAPFRVRIGRYATAKDAEAALKRIKAKGMTGFVARAPER